MQQNEPLGNKYPTYQDRVKARGIDTIIFLIVGIIAGIVVNIHALNNKYDLVDFPSWEFIFWWFLYYPIMESFFGGTIGKKVVGLKSISMYTGKNPTLLQGYVKLLIFIYPSLFTVAILLIMRFTGTVNPIGFVVAILLSIYTAYLFFAVPCDVDEYNQGRHDRASRIEVIKNKEPFFKL